MVLFTTNIYHHGDNTQDIASMNVQAVIVLEEALSYKYLDEPIFGDSHPGVDSVSQSDDSRSD